MFFVSIKFIYEFNLGSSPIDIKNIAYKNSLFTLNLKSLVEKPRSNITEHNIPIVYLGIGPKNIKYITEINMYEVG